MESKAMTRDSGRALRAPAILVLAMLAMAADSEACTCGFHGAFINGIGPTSTVFVGTVREYRSRPDGRQPYAMDVEVEEVLSGAFRGDHLLIWGDQGMSCIPYVSSFPIGTRWVFSVRGPTSISDFGDENYHFSDCQANWLTLFDGCVYGAIDHRSDFTGPQELTLEELRIWLHDRKAQFEPREAFSTLPRTGSGISAPKVVERVAPLFPDDPKCRPAGQTFEIDIAIDSTGTVRRLKPVGEIPDCLYAALHRSVMASKFAAPSRAGVPVSAWHRLSFKLPAQ